MRFLYPLAVSCGLLLCGGALTGCKTIRVVEEQRPLAETTLMVTRAGENMSLSFNTIAGSTYAVFYADRRDAKARWQLLRGGERVVGTGSTVTLTDRVPAGKPRYYRVQLLPQAR
jgi:hypothetical protein